MGQGGSRWRKHKFQGGIVSHGQKTYETQVVAAAAASIHFTGIVFNGRYTVVFRGENIVTPLVATALLKR